MENNNIKSFIIDFHMINQDKIFTKNKIVILKIENKIELVLKKKQQQYVLLLVIRNQEYYFGEIDDLSSQITIHIEQTQNNSQIFSYFLNQKLQKVKTIQREFEQQDEIYQQQLDKQTITFLESNYQLFIFTNFQIQQPNIETQSIQKCNLLIQSIFNTNKQQQICLQSTYLEKGIGSEKQINKLVNYTRKLQPKSVFIHGSIMKSIVRYPFENSQYKSSIYFAYQSSYLLIGYFKLKQTLTGGSTSPIITLGNSKEFYNVFNLQFVNSTYVMLTYIHDTNNYRNTLYLKIQECLGQWIQLGFAFQQSTNNKQAKIVYSQNQDSLIKCSNNLDSTPVPQISDLGICISCDISNVYTKFTGQVSSVKIIQDIDYDLLCNSLNYFFSEDPMSINQPILDAKFDIKLYVQGSEYDVGHGFQCKVDYAFFEGVCIKKEYCSSLVLETSPHSLFENAKFYDSSSNKCLLCSANCIECTSKTECIQCATSYFLQEGQCVRCTPQNPCTIQCQKFQQHSYDGMNYICQDKANYISQSLISPLLSSRFFSENTDFIIKPTLPWYQSIIHCYINVDKNPMTLHSFLGGTYFRKATVLERQWTQIPKGYKKKVTFYALFYGSSTPSNLEVKINSIPAMLNQNYEIISKDQVSCSKSGVQTQSIFNVEFTINDDQNIFNLEISTNVDKWAIRNVDIQIFKCHPSCNTCFGGSESECSSCGSNQILNSFQCRCQLGQFAKLAKCYDTPCITCLQCSIQNCLKCEDLTGYCTQCNQGYKINEGGNCIQDSLCTNDNEIFLNYCGVRKEQGFSFFMNNKIVQYSDYWLFQDKKITYSTCLNMNYLPLLTEYQNHYIKYFMSNYYSYHYGISVSFNIGSFDNTYPQDYIKFQFGSNYQFSKSYPVQQKLTDSQAVNSCYSSQIDKNFQDSTEFINKENPISINFESTVQNLITGSYSFNQLEAKFIRCHPMNSSCDYKDLANNKNCISNAIVVNTKCQCLDGYYFSYNRKFDIGSAPGKCLKCNSSCKTCKGPSYQDCDTCDDGSTVLNNLCVSKCTEGQYWDYNLKTCAQCSDCCKACISNPNRCVDCKQGYKVKLNDNQCYNIQTQQVCQNCNIVLNSFCGGNLDNHKLCISSGWYLKDSNTCLSYNSFCKNFINGQCGGDQSSQIIDLCKKSGFFNYNNNFCSPCSIIDQNSCGRTEIKQKCTQDGWIKFYDTTCINCNPNSLTSFNCKCDSTCNECSQYFSPTSCTSCTSSYSFFQSQCLIDCPNGYTANESICQKCNDTQMPACFSCNKTCFQCVPSSDKFQQGNCQTCSNVTREFNKGQCVCKDPSDVRETFFECSYMNIAVLDAILSSQTATLQISFGKELVVPNQIDQSQFTKDLCNLLFQQETLLLFGSIYSCQFTETAINVKIGNINKIKLFKINLQKFSKIQIYFHFEIQILIFQFDIKGLNNIRSQNIFTFSNLKFQQIFYEKIDKDDSSIYEGDLVKFNINVFSFQSSDSTLINTFYNNVVKQEQLVGESKVIYNQLDELNSCDDIVITFNRFENTGERGFKAVNWSIYSFDPLITNQYNELNDFIDLLNSNKQINIKIPKGLIKPEINIRIRLSYTLKIKIESHLDFSIYLKVQKKVNLQIKSSIIFPFYRFQQGMISIQQSVIQCLPKGDVISYEPTVFSIVSDEYPQFNYNNKSYQEKEYMINIKPYMVPSKKIIINAFIYLVSDKNLSSKQSFTLDVSPTQLYVKIVGGNAYVSYKNKVEIFSQVRDYDLQTETEKQNIQLSWSCQVPGNNLQTCVNKNGDVVPRISNTKTAVFDQSTFLPYTAVKLTLKGTKDTRETSNFIIILFSELDLPPLGIKIHTLDTFQNTINQNEEIYVELDYKSSVNIDLLSFSGTIVYEDDVVGIIKFDYINLKFQIWNYYSGFKRSNIEFQLRFNVFNPQYYMPSMHIMQLNINFPPNKCKFRVQTSSAQAFSLETIFILYMDSCEDNDSPISYQFYFYKSSDDFEYEKKYPLQVKRRQISDKQSNQFVNTNLPSGQILLMAQAIDCKQAIYNSTISIVVKNKIYDETTYLQIIQQKLDQSNFNSIEGAISDLSILSEDILIRNQFKTSLELNQKKIQIINKLTDLSKKLSDISTFVVLADKAISSLVESGIQYQIPDQISLFDSLQKALVESSNIQNSNLEISKEKFKQKLYDYFLVLDSLDDQKTTSTQISQDKSASMDFIQLQDTIGSYLFKNMLPNEDPILFKGQSAKILSTQITQKSVCSYFICSNKWRNLNSDNSDIQPNIYNVKVLQQNENFYQYDSSFQKYTNQLLNVSSDLQVSQYPVITPSIRDQQNQIISSFSNKISLQFDEKFKAQQNKMACLSRKNSEWVSSDCDVLYDEKEKVYTCDCKSLSPTTVIEDLQDLLYKNNLGSAFSAEGIQNIFNFKYFYKYGVVWLLLIQTGGFAFLYFKGKAIDALAQPKKQSRENDNLISELSPLQNKNNDIKVHKNQIVPMNFIDIENKGKQSVQNQTKAINQKDAIFENNNQNQTKFEEDIESKHNESKEKNDGNYKNNHKSQNQDQLKIDQIQKPNSLSCTPILISETQLLKDQTLPELELESLKHKNEKQFDTSIKITKKNSKKQSKQDFNGEDNDKNKKSSTQDKTPSQINKNNNHTENNQNESESQNTITSPQQNLLQADEVDELNNGNVKDSNNPESKSDLKKKSTINEQKFKDCYVTFNQFPIYKQVLFYHNFFCIFYIYNENLPRSLRFLIFYVRSIHSLAMSIIFTQDYSTTQYVGVAIVNAITISLFVKIMEKTFIKTSKVMSVVFRVCYTTLLCFYFYTILSIVSSLPPSESNLAILTFTIFYVFDVLIVASFAAICFRQCGDYMFKNYKSNTCQNTVYKLIDMEIILESLS